MFVERVKVMGGVVRLVILPAGEIDAYQFERQRAAGGVVFVTVSFFVLLVIALGPRFLSQCTGRILVEGLAAELRTAGAHMDRFGVAALSDHRRHAIELSHFLSTVEAIPVGA